MMQAAIIGYGTTANSHARMLHQEGLVLESVVGRLPEQTEEFARQHGFQHWTTDLAEALARTGLEVVVICSPSAVHAEQTEQALLAGKHVLVEIPLAMSFPDAARLTSLAEDRGLTLMVAHTHRYGPAILEVKRRITAGELTVRHIVSRYVFLRRENVDWSGRRRSWTDNLIWHHGCHATDMCLWLLGEMKPGQVAVTAQVAQPDATMGIPMDLSILLRTRGDVLASVNMSYNSHLSLYDYLIIGEETTLLVSEGKLIGREGVILDPAQLPKDDSPQVLQDREFLAAIRERRQPAISGASVLPAMWALEQVEGNLPG
jgi:2-hydroxy-4-carboxymuconate semialdehyde hemiacetal dehydrogenase